MMIWKRVIWVAVAVLICLFIISIPTALSAGLQAEPLSTPDHQAQITDQVEQAILEAIASNDRYIQKGIVPNLQVIDINTSQDQQWATAWVVYHDEQTGTIVPSEPALAVIHYLNNDWQVNLPSDPGWQDSVYSAPEDLLTKGEKDMWVAMNQGVVEAYPTQSGYFLPWHGGQTGYLSRSVGHDADYKTAHYAFDFYMPGSTVCPTGIESTSGITGFNFNIYASRAGTVWGWNDSVVNCDHSAVNFIVLRNIDNPSIFQLYLHLAQDSIPPALKVFGAPVARGQFIGVVDNTGASWGSHLHFQIQHQPYWPADNPYWSTAIDMTFDDVDINGGRPRVEKYDMPYCGVDDICDTFRTMYISNNYYMGDSTPPTGDLSGVTTGETVTKETVTLNGWGADYQTGLDYGQLRAYFNGNWHDLGPQFNPDISYEWDLCDPELPVQDGAVSVAIVLYDIAGNPAPLVGLRHFTKDFSCPSPPPACIPGQDQVSLFEDPYFQGGCVIVDEGNYPSADSLDPLGNNDAESILIGENAIATLYSEENYSGHSQSIITDTAFMSYEWVYKNSLSSMKVSARSTPPQVPVLILPMEATTFREGDVIPLSWFDEGGAVDYQIQIYLDSLLFQTLEWKSEHSMYMESLGQGNYLWRVRARNEGGLSDWSKMSAFSIESPIVYPPIETLPYSDTMETTQAKWVRNGFWSYKGDQSMAHSGTQSWWYQNTYGNYANTQPNIGSLTSPPIYISSVGFYLRFYYRYQTEIQGVNWDQRWVQISVDGKPFENLVLLQDDPQMTESASWLSIKAIDLSEYVGHNIRIRFFFNTVDAYSNNFSGWGIDDFSITATPPSNCDEDRRDDSPAQAFVLTYDPTIMVPGEICPNGDYDYYKFYGHAGDRIVVDINAIVDGSPLDSYLSLLDRDAKTVLAENDDEVFAQIRDPLLSHTLENDGEYYLKLRAWKHPLAGGDDYSYSIRLYEDHVNPVAAITWPASNTYLPDADFDVTVDISDVVNGINQVEFYWHSTNWSPGAWEYLGSDSDSKDGWSYHFNPIGQVEGNNAAFFIRVFDMAGNSADLGAWNLWIDKTAPATLLKPLDAAQPSNAYVMEWTASDNLSGLDYLEIQEQINDGDWVTLPPIDGVYTNFWIIGIPGNAYSYRMHGIDHSGNIENYPLEPEAHTSVPDANVLCYAPDSYDTSGNDNSASKASMILPNGTSQYHNYCNPLSAGYQDDEDWVKMDVIQGQHYFIHSQANSQPTATVISLYAQDGKTLLLESIPKKFGVNTYMIWTANKDGSVYLRLRHLDGRVIGSDVGTTLSVNTGELTYIPLVNR